jgi:RimJ/RimL family protein N-acetyltransferase
MKVTVTPARPEDARKLAPKLSEYVREDLRRGWGVHDFEKNIAEAVEKDSPECWSIAADGEIIGIFGVSADDCVWLVPGKDFDRISISFFRKSGAVLAEMLGKREKIWNYVHEDNKKMIRWLEWCGFTIDDPIMEYRRCELCASQLSRA